MWESNPRPQHSQSGRASTDFQPFSIIILHDIFLACSFRNRCTKQFNCQYSEIILSKYSNLLKITQNTKQKNTLLHWGRENVIYMQVRSHINTYFESYMYIFCRYMTVKFTFWATKY